MDTVKVELEVAKETYEIGQAVSALLKNAKEALKDGFQPGQDLPEIITKSLNDLFVGISGIEKISGEAKEDIEKFIDGVYAGIKPGVIALVKG